jgi:hypothetical protein
LFSVRSRNADKVGLLQQSWAKASTGDFNSNNYLWGGVAGLLVTKAQVLAFILLH